MVCEDRAAELIARDGKWFSLWVETQDNPSHETVRQLEQLGRDTDVRLADCIVYLTSDALSSLHEISTDTHAVLNDVAAGL